MDKKVTVTVTGYYRNSKGTTLRVVSGRCTRRQYMAAKKRLGLSDGDFLRLFDNHITVMDGSRSWTEIR